MKILNDDVLNYLDRENKDVPIITRHSLQIHIDYKCQCKITQDKKGEWVHPCASHYSNIITLNKKQKQ